ncbi:hypothetical protein [Sanguibacter sp. 25GB23B1]|uniref:hypothetical protein n=1 Tax=unclassified Sanguibacter TaxID=2645534 RepID=UPI0032AFBC94
MDTIYTAATQSSDLPGAALLLIVLFYVAILGLMLWVYARIVAKSGHPWPWIFIMFVPIANIVFLCLFAFKQWPIERELAATRAALQAATGSPYPVPQFGGGQFGGGQLGGSYSAQPGMYDHGGFSGGYNPGSGNGFDQGGFDQGGFDQGGYRQQPPSGNPYGPKY